MHNLAAYVILSFCVSLLYPREDFCVLRTQFSICSQVPLTARKRPSHGVHSSSVFQAEVQPAAQVSTFTVPASRAGTEAHLPSP